MAKYFNIFIGLVSLVGLGHGQSPIPITLLGKTADKAFFTADHPMSWEQGQDFCEENGLRLASIQTQAEQEIVQQISANKLQAIQCNLSPWQRYKVIKVCLKVILRRARILARRHLQRYHVDIWEWPNSSELRKLGPCNKHDSVN